MTDPKKRFSERVQDYVRYRPDYPAGVLDFLTANCGLNKDSVVADVGCGTGISSRLFLDKGCTVHGIEPNIEMLDAAREYLAEHSRFIPVNAQAEATTLPDDSIDLVTSFQAFHWFDHESVGREFKRITRPGGWAAIVWNERKLDATPFLIEYEKLLKRHALDYDEVRHDRIDTAMVSQFIRGKMLTAVFDNSQALDFNGLLGRTASSSYMPGRKNDGFAALKNDLKTAFAKYNENGKITVSYKTTVTCIEL